MLSPSVIFETTASFVTLSRNSTNNGNHNKIIAAPNTPAQNLLQLFHGSSSSHSIITKTPLPVSRQRGSLAQINT